MQKKGEVSSTFLVTTFIAIIGFVVVLFFVVGIVDFSEQSTEEACRLSILQRATVPQSAQSYVPLKCSTQKFCLTTDERNDKCTQFGNTEVVTLIEINTVNKDEGARQIAEITANEMYDCWSITGQGKLDVTSGEDGDLVTNLLEGAISINDANSGCIICSRIALSEKLKEDTELLNKVDINTYLKDNQVPNSEKTYLQTFTDRQINAFPNQFEEPLSEEGIKQTDQIAIIFSQLIQEDDSAIESALSTGANSGLIVSGTIISTFGAKSIKGAAALGVAASVVSGLSAYFQVEENQALATAYCGKFTSSDEKAKYGCSLVSTVDYNKIDSINKLCEGILSQP